MYIAKHHLVPVQASVQCGRLASNSKMFSLVSCTVLVPNDLVRSEVVAVVLVRCQPESAPGEPSKRDRPAFRPLEVVTVDVDRSLDVLGEVEGAPFFIPIVPKKDIEVPASLGEHRGPLRDPVLSSKLPEPSNEYELTRLQVGILLVSSSLLLVLVKVVGDLLEHVIGEVVVGKSHARQVLNRVVVRVGVEEGGTHHIMDLGRKPALIQEGLVQGEPNNAAELALICTSCPCSWSSSRKSPDYMLVGGPSGIFVTKDLHKLFNRDLEACPFLDWGRDALVIEKGAAKSALIKIDSVAAQTLKGRCSPSRRRPRVLDDPDLPSLELALVDAARQ